MKYFTIKKWAKHQHYKDRRPPWIKLHLSLFDDYEFSCLQDASKLHLILIWLLASRSTDLDEAGAPILPADAKHLQRLMGLSRPPDLKPLFSSGFLIMLADRKHDASEMLAKRYTETETETYTKETETETDALASGKHPKAIKTPPPAKKTYAPNVTLTEAEYQQLEIKYGKEATAWMIERLDAGKAAKGYVYKSDAGAIRSWVVREWQKHLDENPKATAKDNPFLAELTSQLNRKAATQ